MNKALFKIGIAFAGLISFGSASFAITPESTIPTGWTKQATAAGTQYSNADGTAVVLEGVSMAASPTVKLAAQAMDKPGACEGLTAQPVEKTVRGVDKLSIVAGSVKCAVYLDTSISPPRLLVALDQGDGTGLRFAETIVGGWGRADAAANSNGAAANTDSPVASSASTNDDSALIKAIAAVPKANRPIGYVQESNYVSNGPVYSIELTRWIIFPNGYATKCHEWDPGKLSPTPQSLGKAKPDCSIARWEKNSEGNIHFIAPDISVPSDSGLATHKFAPGQRIEANIGNVQTFGSVGYVPEGLATARGLSGGDLRMTKAGQIAIGSWSSVAIDSTAIVGGSSSTRRPRIGRYYLDGNMIAVADENGDISIRFIFGFLDKDKKKGNPNAWYLTIDGDSYYPTD